MQTFTYRLKKVNISIVPFILKLKFLSHIILLQVFELYYFITIKIYKSSNVISRARIKLKIPSKLDMQ